MPPKQGVASSNLAGITEINALVLNTRTFLYARNKKDRHNMAVFSFVLVGAARFELTASCTRNKRATKLRHAPISLSSAT